ncbi:MAG: glycosyltransferase family 9 protein [Proteobacteria bacterium]|nr:glycosyltransferase family 9 protein [Pseudomonadota bacterium]
MRRILVIKLGALGDFVQAFGPFAAIRRHHPGEHVTLLTTALFAELARASPWFDEVWVDGRPRLAHLGGWLNLRRRMRAAGFARVYDLQTSNRSSIYFQLLRPGPRPEWSGIARGCSHPDPDPRRDALHTVERQKGQLAAAGIREVGVPDLSWLDTDVSRFCGEAPFALLAPGGSAHRPAKRWPAASFAALARTLAAAGTESLLIGTADERVLHVEIARAAPSVRSLAGETRLIEVAALARRARAAVGNDTGPMHLAAAVGCPTVVLFSAASDPALCAPRGPRVATLRRAELAGLAPAEVASALAGLGDPARP